MEPSTFLVWRQPSQPPTQPWRNQNSLLKLSKSEGNQNFPGQWNPRNCFERYFSPSVKILKHFWTSFDLRAEFLFENVQKFYLFLFRPKIFSDKFEWKKIVFCKNASRCEFVRPRQHGTSLNTRVQLLKRTTSPKLSIISSFRRKSPSFWGNSPSLGENFKAQKLKFCRQKVPEQFEKSF